MLIEFYEDDFDNLVSPLTDKEVIEIKKLCHQVEQGWYSLNISKNIIAISELSYNSLLFLFRMAQSSAANEAREQAIKDVIKVVGNM